MRTTIHERVARQAAECATLLSAADVALVDRLLLNERERERREQQASEPGPS